MDELVDVRALVRQDRDFELLVLQNDGFQAAISPGVRDSASASALRLIMHRIKAS